MSGGDTSKLVSAVKDGLHSEWAEFKKTKKAKAKPVCPYAIGGQRDTPIAALESISNGVREWEVCLHYTVDPTVDRSRGVLPSEVMVGAEGQIWLYPIRRHLTDDTPGTSVAGPASSVPPLKPVPVGGKTRQLSPKASLMVAAEQSANYMLDHIKRVSEFAFIAGNNQALIMCLASAALVRSRLNTYKDILKQPTSKNLTAALGRCGEVVEFMMQNVLSYNCDLLSLLLHDAASHDWLSPKPYQEGARCSLTVQIWSFYMQGLRNDLWRYTSPRISESILASIFTDTLSLMVTRYAQIEASDVRLPQYSADVIAILTIVAAFLPSLVASPVMLFSVRIHESVALPIHRRADLLLKVAAVKCAPVENLARVFQKGFDSAVRRDSYPESLTRISSTPSWLTFLNPALFPRGKASLSYLGDSVAVYLTLLTAASRPQPQYSLIVRGLLMRRFLATKTILRGLQDAPGHVTCGEPCGGPLCMPHLCMPPLIPHTVYAAVAQILVQCIDWVPALCKIASPGIKESGLWDSLDRTQVWNVQRPPWHHALVQLLTPSVVGVVAEVLHSVPPQPPAKPAHPSQLSVRLEHHLAAWTLQLLTGMEGVADMVPLPVIFTAHNINGCLPPTIKPTGGHVITQLVVSALYSVINSRSSLDQLSDTPITDGQWDMMIAVGERLCSLHDGNYDTHIKRMTLALLSQLEDFEDSGEEDSLDEYTDEDVIESVCAALANTVLSSVQGQHAMVVVWEFLKRNMTWMQESLGAPSILPPSPEQQQQHQQHPLPRQALNFAPDPLIYNPLYYYKRAIYTQLDQESLINFKGDWDSVLWSDLGLPKGTIIDLIKKRPEFQNNAYLSKAQVAAVKKLRPLLKDPQEEEDEKKH